MSISEEDLIGFANEKAKSIPQDVNFFVKIYIHIISDVNYSAVTKKRFRIIGIERVIA